MLDNGINLGQGDKNHITLYNTTGIESEVLP
jgi:hypothetical protein